MLSPRAKQGLVVLVTFGAIAFMLAAAEVVVRVRQTIKYGTTAVLEDFWTVDRDIGLQVPIAGFSSGRISINSLGFRGPEMTVAKPPRTVRLAFLGASTTWCAEVSGNEYTWPHLVAAELANAFPAARFEYVNAGVPGYGVDSMLRSLQYRVARLAPDVIVVYEGTNNLSRELRKIAVQRGIIPNAQVHQFTWPGRYSLLWYLAEKNLLVLQAQRAAQAGMQRLEVDPGTLGENYRDEMLQLARAARQSARLVVLATFSTQLRRDQPPERQMRASESALFYVPFATPQLLIRGYERYNQILREVAQETGAMLVTGEYDIPGDAVHFTDTVHFTDAGSKAMAQRISRALIASPVLRAIVADNAAAR